MIPCDHKRKTGEIRASPAFLIPALDIISYNGYNISNECGNYPMRTKKGQRVAALWLFFSAVPIPLTSLHLRATI